MIITIMVMMSSTAVHGALAVVAGVPLVVAGAARVVRDGLAIVVVLLERRVDEVVPERSPLIQSLY